MRSLSHLGSCQFSVSALSVDGRSFQDVFYGLFGGLVGGVDGAVGEAAVERVAFLEAKLGGGGVGKNGAGGVKFASRSLSLDAARPIRGHPDQSA